MEGKKQGRCKESSIETNERQDSYTIFIPVASVPTVSKS